MTETTLAAGLSPLAGEGVPKAESGFLVKIKIETPQFRFAGDPRGGPWMGHPTVSIRLETSVLGPAHRLNGLLS